MNVEETAVKKEEIVVKKEEITEEDPLADSNLTSTATHSDTKEIKQVPLKVKEHYLYSI